MKLLKKVRQRLRDMSTLKDTGLLAGQIADEMGEDLVGAEHWLLAALELPDGTARLAFERVGADADHLQAAIAQQYEDALSNIGIETSGLYIPENIAGLSTKNRSTFQAQASCNALFAIMTNEERIDDKAPFMGATIVQAAPYLEKGTVPRSLQAMGIDRKTLSITAEQIIDERSAAA